MGNKNQLKGLYWAYYKQLIMRKGFWMGGIALLLIAILFVVLLLPSSHEIELVPARIVSAGVFESEYHLNSRYKIETQDGDVFVVIENANRGKRDVGQTVCLALRTLRITGSQLANITRDSRCPETLH